MKIRVLGSAAGGGFPQWNCNCQMCKGQRDGSIDALARTQSSIAVSIDGIDWALINTSPDILDQLKANPDLQPARGIRDTGISSIVLMDAQIDHTTGLLMLRENQSKLPIWCTSAVHEDLTTGNPLFKVLSHYCDIDWKEIIPGNTHTDIDGISDVSVNILPLTSNAPPYSPRRDKPIPGDTIGLLMRDATSGKQLFYAPGLGEMESHVWAAMQTADVIMVDGTLWSDDEMITAGAGSKTGKSMGHLAQSGTDGMLQWLDQLPAQTRKILIHINNTNPILNPASAEAKELQTHGVEIAYDGMHIEI